MTPPLRKLTDEESEAFVAEHGKNHVTVKTLLDYAEMTIEAIVHHLKPALARIEALEKATEEMKANPITIADAYKGGWGASFYKRGSLVTFAGSLFLAMRDTTTKPETNSDWVLITKRGRDGRATP